MNHALMMTILLLTPGLPMALEISELWDFQNPEQSEQRFRDALADATSEQALVLQTQIARTYGLRKDYDGARQILFAQKPHLAIAGPEARSRFHLELGRTHVSAAHAPGSFSDEDLSIARSSYQKAYEVALQASLHGLAVDALHMMAFVDGEPEDQLHWARKALDLAQTSNQPAAQKWEASLLHNIGYALHRLGRYEEALTEFQKALVLRERASDEWASHVAQWMVAWTLRALGRADDALEIQLKLAKEREALGDPDRSVYEELEILYRAQGDTERADYFATQARKLP